jgi:hypothetical protein
LEGLFVCHGFIFIPPVPPFSLLLLNFQSFLKEILQLLQKWEMPEFRHFPEKLKRSFEKKVGESPFSRFRK